ncbi:hypothetical protein AYO44_13335 [Planctomycetaceae bacterium SCGC AG-212-F19]|nr:hypothetical protein AYO44_13335 [Planctomycetaceae bacterium SCGC AG-212-F19]
MKVISMKKHRKRIINRAKPVNLMAKAMMGPECTDDECQEMLTDPIFWLCRLHIAIKDKLPDKEHCLEQLEYTKALKGGKFGANPNEPLFWMTMEYMCVKKEGWDSKGIPICQAELKKWGA